MTPEQYEQEYECSFTAAIIGAYYGKLLSDADDDGRIGRVPYDPAYPVHTAWDLGINDSTAIWFAQIFRSGAINVIDYYESSGVGLDHYAEILRQKDYHWGDHLAPHDIEVRELGSGKSRLETAFSLGIRFRVIPKMKVADGINAARMMIPKCHFDKDKCTQGIEMLRQYRQEWDEKGNLLEIIQGMITLLMLRMRLGIWLLGWRIDKLLFVHRNKLRLMSTIRFRYDTYKRRHR